MFSHKVHDELKLLYEVSVRDLEFFKRQQWLASYYTVVLYGALLFLARHTAISKLWFCLVIGGVGVLAIILLLLLEHAIGVRRVRLEAVRNHFSAEFNAARNVKRKLSECHLILVFMVLAVTFGAVLTIFGVAFPAVTN